MVTWVMLIISLTTGQVKGIIPYQTFHECLEEIPLAYLSNGPGTVKITCEPDVRS
jgi:hypothetical protein